MGKRASFDSIKYRRSLSIKKVTISKILLANIFTEDRK